MVDYSIYEATASKPRPRVSRKGISKIGKNLSQADITKKIDTQKGLHKLDPSKLTFTISDLIRIANNRKKFLPTKMGKMRNLRMVSVTPNPASKSLSFRGISDGVDVVRGKETPRAGKYILNQTYFGISFSDKQDKKHKIKVNTKGGLTYFVSQIQRNKNPVQVRCQCEDFNWSFSWWDQKVRALLGQVPSKVVNYKSKGTGIPRNPGHYPSFCKHLYKFTSLIRDRGFMN